MPEYYIVINVVSNVYKICIDLFTNQVVTRKSK